MKFKTLVVSGFFALAAIFGTISSANSHDHMVKVGTLTIKEAWTRETPPNAPAGGAYLTITNTGDVADRLVGGSAAFSNIIEIHDMTMENNVMRMFPLEDGLEIPAGETVTLKPGGLHVMMIGITDPFKEGDTVTITLSFEQAGTVDVEFSVAKIGAKEAHHHNH